MGEECGKLILILGTNSIVLRGTVIAATAPSTKDGKLMGYHQPKRLFIANLLHQTPIYPSNLVNRLQPNW